MPKRKPGRTPKSPLKEDEMLSLDQAAAALGVSRSTLYRWQNQGRLRGFKVGRQWRFRRSDLDKFSLMTHPSAAGVDVSQIDEILAGLKADTKEAANLIFDPAPAGYPTTEEEKAVDSLLATMLAGAAEVNASDLHVEPERDGTVVRQRVDGVLHELLRLPRSSHNALIACVKVHAGLALDQQHLPQDGHFRFALGGLDRDVRAATLPTLHGESIVMRLLVRSTDLPGLDLLRMHPDDRARYERALKEPSGLVICSGPTGSGKTTLLYAGLMRIASPDLKTLTVEDPIECSFPHILHTAINKKAGYTFEVAQRALMRQDPDVIMVGEIRTLESAELCVQAAITGHLVLTQVHAVGAARAVTRLFDMGIEPFMLAETLILTLGIRLARRVCPKCAQPDEPSFSLLSPLSELARAGGYELPEKPKFLRGAGCPHCQNTGYRGRTGLYETMEIDPTLSRLIATRADERALQEAAVKGGMTTIAADGLRKAAEGLTSVAEVWRIVPKD